MLKDSDGMQTITNVSNCNTNIYGINALKGIME